MHGKDLELGSERVIYFFLFLRDEGTTKDFTMNPTFGEENHIRSKLIIIVFTIKQKKLLQVSPFFTLLRPKSD